jgi:hypothetical protein
MGACAEELCRLVTGIIQTTQITVPVLPPQLLVGILSRIREGLVHKVKKQCCTNEVDARDLFDANQLNP